MHLLVVIVAALAVAGASTVNRHMKLLNDIDNHVDTNGPKSSTKNFLTLSRRPGGVVSHAPGEVLSLTCEAVAAPAPSIHWFKNDAPVYEYDKGSTELLEASPSSLARVSSTLLVARTEAPTRYSCLATAGARTLRADTLVYSSATDGTVDNSERSKLVPLAPKILVSYKVYVDTIGSDVVLPCEVKGHPRPVVTWRDNNGNLVKKNSRMEVSRAGALVLRGVSWRDLGAWRCTAKNSFGTAAAETFLYPARPNDTDG